MTILFACVIAGVTCGGWQWLTRVRIQNHVSSGFSIPTQPTRTVDDPTSAYADSVDLLKAADFHFTMGDGSGLYGYDVVKLEPNGRAEYTFLDPTPRIAADGSTRQQWRRVEFTVDSATMHDLRALLRDIGYFRLKKEYHTDIQDRTQRWLKVEASGRKKGVYCNNCFPPEILRVRGFVQERVFDPHAVEIQAATPVDISQLKPESETFE